MTDLIGRMKTKRRLRCVGLAVSGLAVLLASCGASEAGDTAPPATATTATAAPRSTAPQPRPATTISRHQAMEAVTYLRSIRDDVDETTAACATLEPRCSMGLSIGVLTSAFEAETLRGYISSEIPDLPQSLRPTIDALDRVEAQRQIALACDPASDTCRRERATLLVELDMLADELGAWEEYL